MLSFQMPDGDIDLSGESAGNKKDEVDLNVNAQEMVLAGVDTADILATEVDLDRSEIAREEYFDAALANVNFNLTDIDVVSMQQQRVAHEGAAIDILQAGSVTGDKLGSTNENLSETNDELLEARNGSKEVALSVLHREDGWHTFDPDNEHGIWQVGHRHDQDGVYSDVRATINGLALTMNAQGIEWDELNQAMSKGGSLESLDQMRDALSGLNDMAMNRAGFAGFGAFFQALDADLFDRQRVENPKGDVRPALGTPEPEVTPPQMAYRPENQPGTAPGTGGPGMSMRAPA